MIAKIIELSVKNKAFVLLAILALLMWGIWAIKNIPLDAIPDLSDTQVIIYTDWPGKSPDLVENQVTYPITSSLLSVPKVQAVRGFSFLGSSFVYVIFKEGTDIYWARNRVLEYLETIKNKIPINVNPVLGPDATSLGWGFSYALVDKSSGHNLADLRSLQDFNLKLALESVPGVSQVASIGGFVKQYQITINPQILTAYNLALPKVLQAIKKSNNNVEGRVLDLSGREYMIRGLGYVKNIADLEKIVVASDANGTPVYLRDIASVRLGPEIRRGLVDLNGQGEVAGGIVIVRFGENVLNVINRVKAKIKEIEPSLPPRVEVVTTYDRSALIYRSIDTLRDEIIKLSVVVALVCFLFLLHLPSALVIIFTLPVAIVISFIPMFYLKVTSNIMSLSGIAIAIGAMVDASIIMVENAHKKLEEWEEQKINPQTSTGAEPEVKKTSLLNFFSLRQQGLFSYIYIEISRLISRNFNIRKLKISAEQKNEGYIKTQIIIEAAKEVGPSLFFSLLVITVGFLPIFALEAQGGRLFKPLAYTKTFAMLFASFLAITLTPILMTFFIRGKIRPEAKNPITIFLQFIYYPIIRICLKFKKTVVILAMAAILVTAYPLMRLGSEFMPPLFEGSFLYMPVTAPAISIAEARKILLIQDKLLKQVPEVDQVFGKAGRAETPTDPAPLEMFETVINLKPESTWRKGLTVENLINELNTKVSLPGVANSFTMPIKARIDMLSTGIRTPLGIKILGPDLAVIENLGLQIEQRLKHVPGTRSVYAERLNTGYFLDIKVKREEIARFGLSVEDVEEIIESFLGGMNLTTTVEGRERYPVNLRYARDFRDNPQKLGEVLVPLMTESKVLTQVPLSYLAEIKIVKGPNAIKSEGGLLTAYVYLDLTSKDIPAYVKLAKKQLQDLNLPPGYRLEWSGEYQYMQSTFQKLLIMVPLALFIIFFLIFLNTRSLVKTLIIFLAVPFSLVGSFWLLYFLNYNLSLAVWVGIIAMAGLDAETGIIMLLYLDLAYHAWQKAGKLKSQNDLKSAIIEGAVKRIRPKIMTVSVIFAGLLPIMFATGTGADIMKRIAAPMVGGVLTSTILELLIYPVIYFIWKRRDLV